MIVCVQGLPVSSDITQVSVLQLMKCLVLTFSSGVCAEKRRFVTGMWQGRNAWVQVFDTSDGEILLENETPPGQSPNIPRSDSANHGFAFDSRYARFFALCAEWFQLPSCQVVCRMPDYQRYKPAHIFQILYCIRCVPSWEVKDMI